MKLDGTFILPRPPQGVRYEPIPEDHQVSVLLELGEDGRTLRFPSDVQGHIEFTMRWQVIDNRPSDFDDEDGPIYTDPYIHVHICGPNIRAVEYFWWGNGEYDGFSLSEPPGTEEETATA